MAWIIAALSVLHAHPTATPTTTTPAPRTAPQRASRGVPRTTLNWSALRACESHGRYGTDTGNGYYGAYQFSARTWRSVGGTGNPADAPAEEQDMRAALLFQRGGRGQWPVCGRLL